MLVEVIERIGPFALGDPDALSRGARLEVELAVRDQNGTRRYRLPAEMIRSSTDGIGVMLYARNPRTSQAIEAYEHWCERVA